MAEKMPINRERDEHYGSLQRVIDVLFEDAKYVRRLDVILQAEQADLPEQMMEVVNLLPPGDYTRQRLCDQINSSIGGHAWGQVFGTVE